MAFKMSYSFEGNYRPKPEQNLSGASKKQTRDVLIKRAHEERQKRQAERMRLQSALTLQSYIRSYLTRKYKKQEERLLFDQGDFQNVASQLGKFLFFYETKIDRERFIHIGCTLISKKEYILLKMKTDVSINWLIKRFLVICLENFENSNIGNTAISCFGEFMQVNNFGYINNKGYFRYLRHYLDDSSVDIDIILKLLIRSFEYYNSLGSAKENVLSEFCNNFLQPHITPKIKNVVIPQLCLLNFPYNDLILYLNSISNKYGTDTNSLLYCVLALEPHNYEQTKYTILVLSQDSNNLHHMASSIIDLSVDSDTEDMEVSDEHVSLQDYLLLLNNPDRVKKILHYFDEHVDDEEILDALTNFCHNLLLVYKDSIRKFMLVYMLALRGTFLNKLWVAIKKEESNIFSTNRGILCPWQRIHTLISVFCNMFTFYTQTLTDSESTDTSGTFTSNELCSMSELLKNVALNLIDLAFPMCRYNSISSSPELILLYYSCLNAVKMLYMLDLRKKFCKIDFWTKKKIYIAQDARTITMLQRNYLSHSVRPFYGVVPENNDEHLSPLSTIEQRSLAVLQQLPFLIEFNTRVLLLRHLCYTSISEDERLRHDFIADNTITVRRTHLYEDAFEKLSHRNESDMRRRLRIQFINNVGLEEAGIDGGGLFKEFINEVLKTAFDPNRGFFLLTADNCLYPNPNVQLIMDNFSDHYYFIGRLLGKALFESILVDLPLAEFFLAKLLIDRASAHYLKSLDPVLYRNLLYLRDYNGDVQDLGLDFTLVINDLGETRVVELKPNGSNIPVTNDNRLEYIHRLADLKLNAQIKRQCAAFREGLNSVVPILWLKLFNHNELQVIICGDMEEINIEDMKSNTVYEGEFNGAHPTIILFWKIVEKFTDSQKKQLLKFVTSCSRPPLLGFKELNPSFCIQSSGSEDRMPTASTCLNLLKIPVIREEELLRNKLISAIEQQAGFELS
ncbi:hypothetical protein AMK59_6682 [Oryctes borbonicus]|uniref:Ubiquitin-protein ligase E3C n=1 Tax=Oryctes borbonicus TaxID=1629725 RepID=A0A0T6AT84_9SCAR|nr:hypothetical protein AMK59_6682 [Oryctes borbonicus]